MLFSRRKRAVAAEPAPADMGVAGPGDAATSGQTDGTVVNADSAAPLHAAFEPTGFAVPIEPVAPVPHDVGALRPPGAGTGELATSGQTDDTAPQHVAFVTLGSGTPVEPVTPVPHDVGIPQVPRGETSVADLDEFFAALRQVVDDSLARMPLESDLLEPQLLDEAELLVSDLEVELEPVDPAGPDGAPAALARRPEHTIARADGHAGEMVARSDGDASTPSTELAPSTAELIAALEADRDRWRERAIVWRERAMGADMLVKTLNDHMAHLRINLEDLRMVIRVMNPEAASSTASEASETSPAVEPSPPRRDGGTEPFEA